MLKNKLNQEFPSIIETEVLTDEVLAEIESGAESSSCDAGCKKSCQSGGTGEIIGNIKKCQFC